MTPSLYIADRATLQGAAELIARHGGGAALAAAARADESRMLGNITSFCRWRQVERLVTLLTLPAATGTVH